MSDHEGGDIGDWEEAILPGGADFSFRGTDSIVHEILPQNLSTSVEDTPRDPTLPVFQGRRQGRASRAERAPPASYRSEIQAIHGIAHRSTGIQGRKARYLLPNQPITGPAFDSYRRNEEPTATFVLSVTWRVFLFDIRVGEWETPERAARSHMDDICRKTGAYMATPAAETTTILIWGHEEQTEAAKKELAVWFDHIRETSVRPSRVKWHKEKAFDGRTVTRIDQRLREQEMAGAMRRIEENLEYNFEFYYLWPDEPRIADFVETYDKTSLEEIRKAFWCKIEFVESAPAHFKVSAQSEVEIREISLRINYLMMALVKQKGELIRCSHFRLPPADRYRHQVGLAKDPSADIFVPFLHGDPLPSDETDNWTKLCANVQIKNRAALRNAMSRCLSSLYAPTKHVRMRVTYAELGFTRYQRALEDPDYHTIHEFCAMVPHLNTRMSPLGLRAQQGDLANLADELAQMPQFGPGKTCYTLHFDFNSHNESTLRLEIEYEIGIMTGEPEITATRWLEFASDANEYEMLEANVLDLGNLKCNYQIHIGGTKLFEPENTKFGVGKQMYSFKDKIRFDPPADGIKAPLKRRAVYPSGNRDLRTVEEITTVRFPFKNTGGTFELQRKDIYDERGVPASFPISSVWAGKYYYHEWDSMMDDFANLQPGEPVEWNLGLPSFFLDHTGAGAGGGAGRLPNGFRAWLKEVEEIQALLAEGMDKVEAAAAAGAAAAAAAASK